MPVFPRAQDKNLQRGRLDKNTGFERLDPELLQLFKEV